MKKIILISIIFIALISCNQENSDNETSTNDTITETYVNANDNQTSVNALFENIDYPVTVFNTDSQQESVLESESGTEIVISENTFVDKTGKDVIGDVTVKYTEFRTASDIIFNNLDMKYDSAGITYEFQTAGMFNIEAFYKGEPVYIKKGKNINVNFASNVEGDYNFYRYENGNWVYQEPIKAVIDVKKINDNEYIGLKPVELDTKKDLVIDINPDYQHIKELRDYRQIIWKYAGDLSKDEIKAILTKKVVNPELISSGRTGIYIYKFKQGKEYKSLEISPAFTGKAYITAVKKYNENQVFTPSITNNIRRTVSITQLGLMNYDIISKRQDAIFVNADFYIEKDGNLSKLENNPVFHVAGDDDMVIKRKSGDSMGYSKSIKNKLVAVLPGNKIAVLNSKDFQKNMNKKLKDDNIEFVLNLIENPISKPEDLDNIIKGL